MYGEKERLQYLEILLRGLQKMTADADQWMSSYYSKSKRDFYRKLKELKQGSMCVDVYFQELELAMMRACVKKTPMATKDYFVRGLNPELANFAGMWIFMDIKKLVPLVAEHERIIKQVEISKCRSSSKEIEHMIVADPIIEATKEENELTIEDLEEKHVEKDLPNPSTDLVIEEELNVEIHAEKCIEEEVLIPSVNSVVEKDALSDEKERENTNGNDFCETVVDEKVVLDGNKEIESINCFENKESKRESFELSEKNYEKICEKSEISSYYRGSSLVNDDNSFHPHSSVSQVFLDLFPKKPPDRFLSSRSIVHLLYSHAEDSRTNLFEERGNDATQHDASNSNEPLQIPSSLIKGAKNVSNLIWTDNGVVDHVLGLKT